jgi:uncharacterized membrane protein
MIPLTRKRSHFWFYYTTEHSLMIVMACAGVMDSRGNQTRKRSKAAIFLMALLLFSMVPAVAPIASADGARDASITVTISPNGQDINPGESGEYTIRVRNTGSDPVTVQISSSEEGTQECGQYSSQPSQISGQIDAGTYEETAMNVTLTQTAEGSCDTTVTVSAADGATPPGAPAQETSTVTTTAGDGSGSAVFGVDLKMSSPSKTWSGESVVEFELEVENTGQTNETITLTTDEANSGPGCSGAGALSVTLSETSVSVDANESEFVTVSVEVPEGQEADKYCWNIDGVVSNDPSQGSTDNQEFDLTVPELKECTMSLSKSSITVTPGLEGTFSVIFANDGNVDWTISVGKSGSKAGWVSVDGASSGVLEYDDGTGTKTFDLIVSPDDSIEAGSESLVAIQGKEGSSVKCTKEIRIISGQSHDASLSLGSSFLPNIQPGDNGTTTLTVTNQGNGADTFGVSPSSTPQGWSVQLSKSTIILGSKHGNERSGDIEVQVNVPYNALADEQVDIILTVQSNNGAVDFDEITLSVTVAANHGMEVDTSSPDQTGRSDTEVRFPITIENSGNVEDTFRCAVMSQTATPNWATSFEDVDGNKFIEINIAPRSTMLVFLVVSIDGEEELDSSRLTIRITNKDDTNSQDQDGDGVPDNQRELIMLAIQSDRNYQMDARLDDGGLDGRSGRTTLAPDGVKEYGIWVKNTGDVKDYAVFEINGLEGLATRTLRMNGLVVEDPIQIPVGYGIWNLTRGQFVFDESATAITESSRNGVQSRMLELDLFNGHEVRPFEQYFLLTITVNPSAETGDSGVLEIVVMSESNSANRSGRVSVALDVQIIYELTFMNDEIDEEIVVEYKVSFSEKTQFEIELHNTGNIRSEFRVFASENLRGWSVSLENTYECDREGVELVCWIDVDSSILIEVTVRPPSGAEIDDTFKFTLSSEPVETGVVDRQNLEFTVHGEQESGLFGSSLDSFTTSLIVSGLVISLLAAYLMRKKP